MTKNNELDFAISQANGLLSASKQLDKSININNTTIEQVAPINILIGLSIELYIKAILKKELNSDVKGHNLEVLYKKLKVDTQLAVKEKYQSIYDPNAPMTELGIINSVDQPDKPSEFKDYDFNNFDEALNAISETFVDSRYFYETLNSDNWSIMGYYYPSAYAIALSVKAML